MGSRNKKNRLERSGASAPPRWRARLLVAALFATLVLAGAVFWAGCGRKAPERSGSSEQVAPAPTSASPDENRVFSGYAGSASCRDCHEEAYELWQTSHHALAERPFMTALDNSAFEPPRSFRHGTQHTDVSYTNGQYQIVTLGTAKRYGSFDAERVIGNDPLREFLVKFPGGRFQVLETAYDPHRNEWFDVFGDEDRQPGEWGHWTGRGMNWNSMCASCHNTRLRKGYDEGSDTYATTMAEMSVGCEACHGPLKAHNEWQQRFGKSGLKDPTVPKLTRNQVLDNCGFCHARRSDLTGDFKPGDRFSDHMQLTMVDSTDTYYSDGQVHEEDYEYAAFLGSRMHFRGVSCLDCHDAHSATTKLPGNWLCMRCHDGSYTNAPIIQPVAHSHHKVFGYDTNGVVTNFDLTAYQTKEIKETGGECVNCHMPQTVYMQRHWRHDHGFTIPDPLLTRQYNIPNACNRCHQDQNTDWALKYCENWYGAKMDRPTRHRAQIIAGARRGSPQARDGLLALFASEEIPYWRAVAAGLLEPWVAEPKVSAELIRGLADTNALVRAACVRTLQPLADANVPHVLEALRSKLDDSARSVRVATAWALRSSVKTDTKAGSELLHSLQVNSDQPTGQMQEGVYALTRGEVQQALLHYRRAVAWDPNSAPIRHDYAIVLSQLGHTNEAVTQLEAACRLEPANAEFRYKLGLAWNEAGRTDKAIESLQMAVKRDPHHVRAWYNLGLALNSVGRVEEALTSLTRAESAAPGDPTIPYARATILAQLGRESEARQAARRALEIQPNYSEAQQLYETLSH